MINRKTFLKRAGLISLGAVMPFGAGTFASAKRDGTNITILYTNDTHARLDPFPENARQYAGMGGIARRASLVKKVRALEKHVLLLDSGDVFQGTPWFDIYGGKVDLELMSGMNYDAMVLGNHEFDRGPDGLADAAGKAKFPMLASNYITRGTPLEPFVQRRIIREFDGFRVGIFGLGIEFQGVVNRDLHGDVRSQDPVPVAKRGVESLRDFHRCDFVICLSHLGYWHNNGRIDDITLAKNVPGIDLIIGGHTHTFLDEPVMIENGEGLHTVITQMGHSGVRVGRFDLWLPDAGNETSLESSFYIIDGTENRQPSQTLF